MGLRGITVLESSGDTGVGAACQANDGSKKPAFTPQFPGTCPFITAVGGTQAVSPEVAWDASSGGFSNYFPRAWYQENAVETYLHGHIDPETKKNYESYTNFQGRGFPDISAHSFDPPYVSSQRLLYSNADSLQHRSHRQGQPDTIRWNFSRVPNSCIHYRRFEQYPHGSWEAVAWLRQPIPVLRWPKGLARYYGRGIEGLRWN